jgi:hypothetical protein
MNMMSHTQKYLQNTLVMVMDVLDMSFDQRFDVVVDKACFDCICSSNKLLKDANQYLTRVHNILNYGGFYLCLSAMPPDARLDMFRSKEFDWNIEDVKEVSKISGDVGRKFPTLGRAAYYGYIARRKLFQKLNSQPSFGYNISVQRLGRKPLANGTPLPSQKQEAELAEKQLNRRSLISRIEAQL